MDFFSSWPGNFGLKNGGDFLVTFAGLRFPRDEARTLLKKIGGKFRGKIRDYNLYNSGSFRSATVLG